MKNCSQDNVIGCTNGIHIANALLKFRENTGEYTIDEATGNTVDTGTEVIEVTAYFEGRLTTQEQSGVNPQVAQIEGYLVQPKTLPVGLWDDKAEMVYTDPETGESYTGVFFKQPIFRSGRPAVLKALANRIGSRITGTFQRG